MILGRLFNRQVQARTNITASSPKPTPGQPGGSRDQVTLSGSSEKPKSGFLRGLGRVTKAATFGAVAGGLGSLLGPFGFVVTAAAGAIVSPLIDFEPNSEKSFQLGSGGFWGGFSGILGSALGPAGIAAAAVIMGAREAIIETANL